MFTLNISNPFALETKFIDRWGTRKDESAVWNKLIQNVAWSQGSDEKTHIYYKVIIQKFAKEKEYILIQIITKWLKTEITRNTRKKPQI
jgi:hypothetical protein